MSENFPFNKLNRELAEAKLAKENFNRITLSFYKYVAINSPEKLRENLFHKWEKIGVLGRVYLAQEGINAQISVPTHSFKTFKEELYKKVCFQDVPFKFAVEENTFSFYKLTIKVKKQIVADGLSASDYDVTNVGKHLTPKQWNEAINNGAIVVDMRNHYESEIGHFKNALLPQSETFREELPMVKELLKDKENEDVLLYCTGGIRCEKASAYLKNEGFENVNQLYGGIINYVHEVNEQGIENKFIGKNFVFDDRLSERVSTDVVSNCHQCDKPCDTHTNCKNVQCNLLFIQCEECQIKHQSCCSPKCIEISHLPKDEQKKLRAGKEKKEMFHSHRKVNLRSKFK
jgi:UPF0176 protein